jgi:hypothetical protein
MLAEAIAMLPGNSDFSQSIDFSSAFRLCVGEDWYVVAETLFLMSCAVQACSGIVEAAQSLDGFIASFLLGRTWGIQFYPSVEFITWSDSHCHLENNVEVESGLGACTPFHNNGPIVLTLGFVLTTAMFLPLGRGHLKETITIQFISTTCLFVLLTQFSSEFFRRGFDFPLPWVGDSLSNLVGVVLFNFAYSITIPAWLSEKQSHVSVNTTIWTCTAVSSWIYLSFGFMGAMTFDKVGSNILVVLASGKVHYLTRICAAVFGATIIGCGVPVFCVIIKNALYTNNICDSNSAVFWGAYAPYLISWLLYQGTILMTVLSWTGLVINGMVAFILPMVLAYKCLLERNKLKQQQQQLATFPAVHSYDALSSVSHVNIQIDSESGVELTPVEGITSSESSKKSKNGNKLSENGNGNTNTSSSSSLYVHSPDNNKNSLALASPPSEPVSEEEEEEGEVINSVLALPLWMEPARKWLVLCIIWFFTFIICFTIVMDILSGAGP